MLRKDLIKAMDQATKAKEKVKELKDTLKVEKKLVIQKDEEVQATILKTDKERVKVITKFLESDCFSNLKFVQYFKGFKLLCTWMMKHHSQVANFVNLDFKAIDTEILADETKEKEGETIVDAAEGDGTTLGGVVDEACESAFFFGTQAQGSQAKQLQFWWTGLGSLQLNRADYEPSCAQVT